MMMDCNDETYKILKPVDENTFEPNNEQKEFILNIIDNDFDLLKEILSSVDTHILHKLIYSHYSLTLKTLTENKNNCF